MSRPRRSFFGPPARLPLDALTMLLLTAIAIAATPAGAQSAQGQWQKPGEIQQPKGTWQTPGEIQIPRGIEAIHRRDDRCARRLQVGADALFAFNQATLEPAAEETLQALLPLLKEAGAHPVRIEGHTDSMGSDAANQTLSETRATAVRDWLVQHGAIPAGSAIRGFGKRQPAAPNTHPDGSDDPLGRQRNRRVEVVVDTCTTR